MDQSLKEYADALVKNGLVVYYPEKPTTYFWFSDGVNIGYTQIEKSGFSFSTVHRPNKHTGDGFNVEKHVYPATVFDAVNTFKIPNWALNMQCVKYRNWEQFRAEHWQPLQQHSI
jgi:hypothetical protein